MSHSHERPHKHPQQPDSEDEPQSYYQTVAQAVEELLIEKGLISSNEMAAALDYWASRTAADGARIVARCWTDTSFATRIEQEGVNKAAAALGLDVGSTPIVAALNTPSVHNVLVCTLCSCYPVGLLGESPGWYKSRAYRARVVREPRAVLTEFGTELPPGIEVRVHDSTADLRYIVIPMRPKGTEGMTEEQLAALVTRDSMIGTTIPTIETK